jgi:hypothetical protein
MGRIYKDAGYARHLVFLGLEIRGIQGRNGYSEYLNSHHHLGGPVTFAEEYAWRCLTTAEDLVSDPAAQARELLRVLLARVTHDRYRW